MVHVCTKFLTFWVLRHFNVSRMRFNLQNVYTYVYTWTFNQFHLEKLRFNLEIVGLFEGVVCD